MKAKEEERNGVSSNERRERERGGRGQITHPSVSDVGSVDVVQDW